MRGSASNAAARASGVELAPAEGGGKDMSSESKCLKCLAVNDRDAK